MKKIEEIIKEVEQKSEKPFVTARFGDNWREHIKQQFLNGDIVVDDIINIAWKQGRTAMLLETELGKALNNNQSLDKNELLIEFENARRTILLDYEKWLTDNASTGTAYYFMSDEEIVDAYLNNKK